MKPGSPSIKYGTEKPSYTKEDSSHQCRDKSQENYRTWKKVLWVYHHSIAKQNPTSKIYFSSERSTTGSTKVRMARGWKIFWLKWKEFRASIKKVIKSNIWDNKNLFKGRLRKIRKINRNLSRNFIARKFRNLSPGGRKDRRSLNKTRRKKRKLKTCFRNTKTKNLRMLNSSKDT